MPIRYKLLTLLFLSISILGANDDFKKSCDSLFTSYDLAEIKSANTRIADIIVLKDGTRLEGRVTKLPGSVIKFGEIAFDSKDVFAVTFSQSKMQVITQEGYQYTGDFTNDSIAFSQYFPSIENPVNTRHQTIDPQEISYILTATKKTTDEEPVGLYFTIQFNNGNTLPVHILDKSFQLSNGWKEYDLLVKRIIDINFDKVISGIVLDDEGQKRKLESSIVKDKFLHLQVVKSEKNIAVTWDEVSAIQRGDSWAFVKDDLLEASASEIPIAEYYSAEEKQKIYLLNLMNNFEAQNIYNQYHQKNLQEDLRLQKKATDSIENHIVILTDSLFQKECKFSDLEEKNVKKIDKLQNKSRSQKEDIACISNERNNLTQELDHYKFECLNQKEQIDQFDQYMATLKSCYRGDEENRRLIIDELEGKLQLAIGNKECSEKEAQNLSRVITEKEAALENTINELTDREKSFAENIFLASRVLQQERDNKLLRESEIESLVKDIKEKEEKLYDYGQQIISIDEQTTEIQNERDDLVSCLQENEKQLNEKECEIEEYRKNYLSSQDQQKDLQTQIDENSYLSQKLEEAIGFIESREEELSELRSVLAEKESDMENSRDKLACFTEEIAWGTQILEEEIARRESLERDLFGEKNMVESLTSEKKSHSEEMQKLEDAYRSARAEDTRQHQMQVEQVLEQLRKIHLENEELGKHLYEKSKLLVAKECEIDEYRKNYLSSEDQQKDLQTLKDENSYLSQKLEEAIGFIESREEELSELRSVLAEKESDMENSRDKLACFTEEIASGTQILEEEIARRESLERDLSGEKNMVESLTSERKSLSEEMQKQKDAYRSARAEDTRQYQMQVEQFLEQLRKIHLENEELGKHLYEKSKLLVAKECEIDEYRKNYLSSEDQQKDLQTLKDENSYLSQKLEEAIGFNESREEELSELRSALAEKESDMENSRDKLACFTEEIASGTQILEEEIARRESLERDLSGEKNIVESLKSERKSHSEEMQKLEDAYRSARAEDTRQYQMQVEQVLEQLRKIHLENEELGKHLYEKSKLLVAKERTVEEFQKEKEELLTLVGELSDQNRQAPQEMIDEKLLVLETEQKRSAQMEEENRVLKEKLKESIEIIDFLKSVLPESN